MVNLGVGGGVTLLADHYRLIYSKFPADSQADDAVDTTVGH